jgi:S-adenosylmethionine/arginine decarboxylase-like enzyme
MILDLHDCNIETFTREHLTRFFIELCDLINMKRHGDPMFWHDDSDVPHLKGVSAVQFIETSNIGIHCLSLLKAVYLNLFSCKPFDVEVAQDFTTRFFGALKCGTTVLDRT